MAEEIFKNILTRDIQIGHHAATMGRNNSMLSSFSFDPMSSRRKDESESEESENGDTKPIDGIKQPPSKSTELCNHSHSCRRNAIKSFSNIFKWSLIVKLSL